MITSCSSSRGLAWGVNRRFGRIPAVATAYRDASESAASGPVPAAGLTEVAGLRQAIVVEVTKLGVS